MFERGKCNFCCCKICQIWDSHSGSEVQLYKSPWFHHVILASGAQGPFGDGGNAYHLNLSSMYDAVASSANAWTNIRSKLTILKITVFLKRLWTPLLKSFVAFWRPVSIIITIILILHQHLCLFWSSHVCIHLQQGEWLLYDIRGWGAICPE